MTSISILLTICISSCEKDIDLAEDSMIETATVEQIITPVEVIEPSPARSSSRRRKKSTDILLAGNADPCKFATMCDQDGKAKSMPIEGVYAHIKNGGSLFSCSADEGLSQGEILNAIIPTILANGGDITSFSDQKAAFQSWYAATYCGAGDDGIDDGGVFDGDAGTDL